MANGDKIPLWLLRSALMCQSPNPKTVRSRVARAGLRALGGWEFEGDLPAEPRVVTLAVPHSHNLDGLLLVLLANSVGLNANWMVKDIWTKGPLGWMTRPVGAIAVNRDAPGGVVEQMVEQFNQSESFHLLVPPEGTRSRTEYWKSGFYRIAMKANVPVVPSFLDYARKRGGFGPAITLTGDKQVDMDEIRAFYADIAPIARRPEQVGPIRLKDE